MIPSLQNSARYLTASLWMMVSVLSVHVLPNPHLIYEWVILKTMTLSLPDDELGSQRQRSRSVQYSPRPHHADTLDAHYNKDRRASANDQLADSRYATSTHTHGAYFISVLTLWLKRRLNVSSYTTLFRRSIVTFWQSSKHRQLEVCVKNARK